MSLMDAYLDLKCLLNRGYRKRYALTFVANHYLLTSEERHVLARCVFPASWIGEVRQKLLAPEDLQGKSLAIDGFNVLITLESLVEGKATLCEDGLVRDLKYQGRYKLGEKTRELLKSIGKALEELEVSGVVFFYGKNTPMSGVVKTLTEEIMEGYGIPHRVQLVKSPDFELKRFKTVATADTGIIAKVPYVFDLARYVGETLGRKPLSFDEVLDNM